MSYLDEIEKIKESDLDPAEKKKQIKKLRRQARKARIVKVERVVESEEMSQLSPDEMLQRMIEDSGLPQGDPKKAHYYYSIQGCIARGTTYQTLLEKYRSRWNADPKDYCVIHQGKGLFFGLGPT